MNFTFFNRHTGDFGQLSKSGIETLLTKEAIPNNALKAGQAMDNLEIGQYFYVGHIVITRVIGGIRPDGL